MKTLSIDDAFELAIGITLEADESECGERLEFVHDKIDGTRRWDVDHTITFRHDGQLYGFDYMEPATEYQEAGTEARFFDNPVPVFPMKEVQVTSYSRAKES